MARSSHRSSEICPCHPHHHLVVLCSPPALSPHGILLFLPAIEEVRREYPSSGAAVSPHRIYRFTDPKARRAYQYVNESPTGTTSLVLLSSPLFSPSVYIDIISGESHKYLACRPHFFRSLTLLQDFPQFDVSPVATPSRMNHGFPRDIPITNSTLTPLRRVSWF